MKPRILTIAVVLLGLLGCAKQAPVTLQFRIAEEEPGPGLTEFVSGPSGTHLFLHPEAFVSEADVDSAAVVRLEGQTGIAVLLTSAGAQRLAEITEQNVGKRCGVVLNGKLVSSPRILDPIRGGRAVITADFTEAQAQRIARELALGHPTPIPEADH